MGKVWKLILQPYKEGDAVAARHRECLWLPTMMQNTWEMAGWETALEYRSTYCGASALSASKAKAKDEKYTSPLSSFLDSMK